MSRNAKIVVVGGGFAGLAAASSLIKAGFKDVKILEAKSRVGGRVNTTKPFTENIIELGANWIHGQVGNPLYKLASTNNLLAEANLTDDNARDYFFKEDGKLLSEDLGDRATAAFENLNSLAQDTTLPDKYNGFSLGDYLDAECPFKPTENGSRIFEWCKRNTCTDEASSSLYQVSASEMSEYIDLDGEYYNVLGRGGYQAILDVIMKDLPSGTILNNTSVKNIQWNPTANEDTDPTHPVRLICENGQIYEADHVIVTVSLGVLKDKARTMFTPALPKAKLDAIEKLGFGTVDKIFLYFTQKFWPDDCAGVQLVWNEGPEDKSFYSTHVDGDTWKQTWFKKITGFDTVVRHPTVLCGWITGREALHMETLQDKEIGDTCVRLLRSFTGWSVPEVSKVLISRWGRDPNVLGSYSYVPKDVNGVSNQKALMAPFPSENLTSNIKKLQVLFAGEATHVKFYTTAHGAYLSGVREAQRLINYYTY